MRTSVDRIYVCDSPSIITLQSRQQAHGDMLALDLPSEIAYRLPYHTGGTVDLLNKPAAESKHGAC